MLGERLRGFLGHLRAIGEDCRGGVQIWVAGSLIAVVGLAGFAVDGSYFYVLRNQLQNAADSAALAGAIYVSDVSLMRAEAMKYANMNMPADDKILSAQDVQRGHWDHGAKTFTANASPTNAVQVTTRKAADNDNAANTFFSRVLGFGEVDIATTAIAAFDSDKEWDIIIVQDVTGSFSAEIGDARDANRALLECVRDRVSGQSLVGMVLFTGVGTEYRPMEEVEDSFEDVEDAIDALDSCSNGSPGMPSCSGTHVGAGMEVANNLFSARPSSPDLGRAMVILGDGAPNASGPNAGLSNDDLKAHAVQQANIADSNDISVYTVLYDENDDDSGAAFFESLVRGSGEAHRTPDSADLPAVFASLCSEVPPRLVR